MAVSRDLTDDLRLAHLMADDADSLSMSRFKALDLRFSSKPDNTPVTEADTAVEQSIRRTLARTRRISAGSANEVLRTSSSAAWRSPEQDISRPESR